MMLQTLLAASTLSMAANLSNAEKLADVAPYFSPGPNTMLSLDAIDLKYQRSKNPQHLFGEILVSPPKGSCFRLEKSQVDRDENICHKESWRFTVADLAEDGSLNVKIWLQDQKNPIIASWNSIYRKGRLRPHGLDARQSSNTVTIANCQIKTIEDARRLVTISFLGKTPELQMILPPRASEQTHAREMRVLLTFSEPAAPPTKKPAEKKHEPEKKHETVKNHEKAPTPMTPTPEPLKWDIKGRTYLSLAADQIISQTAPTPGMHGSCRYTYEGYGPHAEHGLIECHQTSDYDYLNNPLTCLNHGES